MKQRTEPIAEADRLQAYYDQAASRGGDMPHADHVARAGFLVRLILRTGARRILDAGAGRGTVANRLHDAGLDVVALDLSPVALHAVHGARTVVGSIDALPFEDRSFELVLASEVLEHLPDPTLERTRHELARVAASWIVLTVPNREDLLAAALLCPRCGCRFHAHRHLQSFDAERLGSLVPGFRPVGVAPFGPLEARPSRAEAALRRDLLGRWRVWGASSVCPQCAFDGETSTGIGDVQIRRAGDAASALSRLARPFRSRRHRWLAGLFEREPLGRAAP